MNCGWGKRYSAERKLAVTWSLRRNTDKGLPATHTVEMMFKVPSDPSPQAARIAPRNEVPSSRGRSVGESGMSR
jgi:hypothetical protein